MTKARFYEEEGSPEVCHLIDDKDVWAHRECACDFYAGESAKGPQIGFQGFDRASRIGIEPHGDTPRILSSPLPRHPRNEPLAIALSRAMARLPYSAPPVPDTKSNKPKFRSRE